MIRRRLRSTPVFLCLLTALALASPPLHAGDRPLELVDLMKLRQIRDPSISEQGRWVAYALEPDRGDGEAVARATDDEVEAATTEYRIERGSQPVLSADGRWFAALVQPPLAERLKAEEKEGKETKEDDDGPKTGLALVSLDDGRRESFERVEAFAFSGDGRWIAWKLFEEEEGEGQEEPEEPTEEPAQEPVEEPEEEFEEQPEEGKEEETEAVGEPEEGAEDEEKEEERVGTSLRLRRLADGRTVELAHVESWAFDETGAYLAYSVAAPGGEGNGLFVRDLRSADGGDEGPPAIPVRTDPRGRYTAITWTHEDVDSPRLAFVAAVDDEEGEPGDAEVWLWEGGPGNGGSDRDAGRRVAASDGVGEEWFVPSENELTFSRDGERLFFGRKPVEEKAEAEDEEDVEEHVEDKSEESEAEREEGETEGPESEGPESEGAEAPIDPYDLEALVEKRELTVWHGDDPLIQTNQKERWEEVEKRTYTAVVHLRDDPSGSDRIVPLADREVREVRPSDNPRAALGIAEDPWFKQRTWEGFFYDLYRVDLDDGSRQQVARKLSMPPSLSPDGRFVLYYHDRHWHLFEAERGSSRNLTESLPVPFADEDHDYPSPPPGYSVAGWVASGEPLRTSAVLVTDKYDLWQFPTDEPGTEPFRLTGGRGREHRILFRAVELDPDQRSFSHGEGLLLTEYHDRDKSWGFAAARVGEEGVTTLVHEPKKFSFVARAEEADAVLYTRESYREFPDLRWGQLDLTRPALTDRGRLSRANPQIADYAWGTAELVEWQSLDGEPLQGVLIRPEPAVTSGDSGNPVLVYFYRFFSQRLHDFNEPVVNHRPSFPFYASHGYAVFLPDIRFEVGRPGLSAVKALVPGVQKLIEMGVADPDALGLHGHSWSGYQTAFVVTQTNVFAAAVAGAPVTNMTSAYSGIRWGSGLARQFQYERSQSRIGGSLWEARHLYLENSPVFYADRIQTPLLMQFGDQDGAVPWTQGIELYLAMRRLGKEVIFLQYEGEPHHLEKYTNKVDYSIKMKQFFDHHLQGEPAPEWMTEGVPYRGE